MQRIVYVALLCVAAGAVLAQDAAKVVGKGFVAGAGGEERAVEKAKTDAVRQQAILLMGADAAKESMDQLTQKILPTAAQFIRNHKVIQVTTEDGVTTATVMAEVDQEALKRVLLAKGLLSELTERPRVMLLPELDIDVSGPVEPRGRVQHSKATFVGPAGHVTIEKARELASVPGKPFELVRTLLTRAMVERHFDLVDPGQGAHVAQIYQRLKEFRDVGTASRSVDSLAQQVAYKYNADVIVFYKLLVHEVAADPDTPKVKMVHDSVMVRAVRADTGRILLTDERSAKGLSESDDYLAHKMAVERVLHKDKGREAEGLASYVVTEIEKWWVEYLRAGRPITINFYVQGEDALRLQQMVGLLTPTSVPGIVGQPRQRRVVNSEQTKETFGEYEVSFRGPLVNLQQALLEKLAAVKADEAFTLKDKYRINVDAFGENVTVCLLDPSRQEIRKPTGIAGVTGGVSMTRGEAEIPLQELSAAAVKATVFVRSFKKGDEGIKPLGHGSGFFVTPEGHVITNFHVVNGGDKFFVQVEAEGQPSPQFDAELVRQMPDRDLALLKVKLLKPEDASFAVLELGQSAGLRVGDPVVAIGSPFFAGMMNNVTVGIVSALNRGPERHIVHTAPIFSGSSGGPLLNMQGQVVGVNVAMPTGQVTKDILVQGVAQKEEIGRVGISGFAFAIPAELAAELLR